jgi:membrane-associated phospholipid phosphatase
MPCGPRFKLVLQFLAAVVALAHGDRPAIAQALESRASLIARAQVWAPTDIPKMDVGRGPAGADAFDLGALVPCDYVGDALGGNSPKFECRVRPGDDVRVKFGAANGEVYGEVAASRLLWALGFGADRMYPVRVACRGCPESVGGRLLPDGRRLIDPAVIERKVEGVAFGAVADAGWSWPELDLIDEAAGGASRAQRDALKLLAAFMQHTDTKPEQQRMVCADALCDRPFMMLNDVGLTFGRANLLNENATGSVNLQEWAKTPVWKGGTGCVANLARSFSGTLKDPVISEDGRRFLARLLAQLSDAQRLDLFAAARVDLRPRSPDDRESAVATARDWVRVFDEKESEIANRRCAEPWSPPVPFAFAIGPVLWLQSLATPTVTRVMNGISLLGYTPAYIAFAVLLTFACRLRPGAALLLLLALNAALSDAAKVIVSFPRPDAVDTRVVALGLFEQVNEEDTELAGAIDPGAIFGFPSGHVAATTAFFIGLAILYRWRWAWKAMLVWIPLMALSRIYLGRHFVGDVLGGVAVGTVSAAIAMLWWKLPRIETPARGWRVTRRALYTGAGLALLALIADIPPAYEAGRLVGFALAALLVTRRPPDDDAPPAVRVRRIALAALLYTVTWWLVGKTVPMVPEDFAPVAALMAGALPATVLLPGPLYVERWIARQKVSI